MSQLTFFVGKGGVGKTTVAAAYATHTAFESARNRVLLISTDPAHSLGDVFQKKLGESPTRVPLNRGKLWAWELDSTALFREFLRRYKQSILEIVERGSLFTADEIAPLLDNALPGMSEMAALLAIRDAVESGDYSHIVIDTAPFGHTLRLFNLPQQFAKLIKFLELAAGRDRAIAEHFGGIQPGSEPRIIEDWREKIEQLTKAISDSSLWLVTTAERFALRESVRCIQDLSKTNSSLKLHGVVLNRVVRGAGKCQICQKRAGAARAAGSFLRSHFSSVKLFIGEDPGFPILGADALGRFGEHVFSGKPLAIQPEIPTSPVKQVELSRAEWPKLTSRVSFVVGKGGVGKTTISAALGFYARQSTKTAIEICSVDPAPSLDDIFQEPIGDTPSPVLGDQRFRASELDSVELFKNWIAEIRQEVDSATTSNVSGVHIDLSFERELLAALLDIVPPGLDEVLGIFRISDMRQATTGKIIIDMAPTGHALELLRTPEKIVSWSRVLLKSLAAHRKLAIARNAAVRIAELELRARELANALKEPGEAAIFLVMLPEPLPDRETERLLSDLDRLGLKPRALFVNRILCAQQTGRCPRCRSSAKWQMSVLARLRKRSLTRNSFAICDFPEEIVARKGLRKITSKLWQLG
ncbi:MAG TPA: TRC40/GET3/ArsA family transport-energizing ATPase [Terriglobales bacterium]|nr:TRC40/GET3/ArsA family transport-energizing ATPase [Terriglobales bacterium]